MKNKKNYIFIAIGVVFLILVGLVMNNNKEDNKSSNNELNHNSVIEDSKTNVVEYYKDNQAINKFLNIYNELYTDNKIDSEMLTVYHHHGSDHKDQVQFYLDELQITLSGITDNKVSVYIDNTKNYNSDEALRGLTKRFVKVFNKDVTDSNIDEYLNNQGNSSDIQTYDGIEYQTSKGINNNIIEYIKLTGNI